MVTMELVLDLDRGGRLARALLGRVLLLWDTGQARGGKGSNMSPTGDKSYLHFPSLVQ